MNINDILKKVELTGYYLYEIPTKNDCYKHLSITEDEFNFITNKYSIENFAKENNINFITLLLKGKINFTHYTLTSYKNSILEKGLEVITPPDFTSDLGYGLYVVEKNDKVGKKNIGVCFEHSIYDDMLKVTGKYKGHYLKCIYGKEYENLIVITDSISNKNLKVEEVDLVEEFNYKVFR